MHLKYFLEQFIFYIYYAFMFTSSSTCASNITIDVHSSNASNPITSKDLWGIRSKIGKGEYKFIIVKKLMEWKEAQGTCESLCTTLANFPSLTVIKGVAEALYKLSIKRDAQNKIDEMIGLNSSMNNDWDLKRQYWIGQNNLPVETVQSSSSERPLKDPNEAENRTDAMGITEKDVTLEQCATFQNPILYNYTDASTHMIKNEYCANTYYGICAPRGGVPTDSNDTEKKNVGWDQLAEKCGPKVTSVKLDFHYHLVI